MPITFDRWLLGIMEARGLTQTDVEALSEVSQGTISRWVNGERLPRPATFARLARALGMDVEKARAESGLAAIEDLDKDALTIALRYHQLSPKARALVRSVIEHLEGMREEEERHGDAIQGLPAV